MQGERLRYFIPAFIWAVVIFGVSSIPDLSTPSFGFKLMDKLAHFGAFFILGLFVAYGFGRQNLDSRYIFWISVIVSVVYGISDEAHQFFVPGRRMDGLDMLADAMGAAVASGLYTFKLKKRID